MEDLLEHAVKAMVVIGSGYMVTMLIVVGSMLRAARRTSDDWEEYTRNTPM